MKTLFYFFFSLLTIQVSGQIGINTATPKIMLDVVGKPVVPNHYDGIIPPRITGDHLSKKIYSVSKKGALFFVAVPYILAGQVINITEPGIYYFDENLWQPAKGYRSFDFATGIILTPPAVKTFVLKSVTGVPSWSSQSI
ncbi:hypothetical protein [Chryseobacterium cheonjiense]|uniref:Uncharacterized protein n=1 Tax=Chryseobacterium cheonjiense TaxID=2728845 RepID=A0A7Y0A576_9FLAO|nr:hypothetical protein [Chryseobacterium cheonjiense]NML56791.1 hypothetical protein [Chryseobacterium cheonjiense]